MISEELLDKWRLGTFRKNDNGTYDEFYINL